jgi:hypothetical protein
MSALLADMETTNTDEVLLVKGQFIKVDGVLWQFVNKTKDNLCEFWSRKLARHESFDPGEIKEAWKLKKLVVVPLTAKPAKESVLRNIAVPFKHYNAEQQRMMEIREYYVKLYHPDFLAGKVSRGPKSVEKWLEFIALPSQARSAEEHLSKWAVVRAYDDWIAGGQCIEALSHGNAWGTHESTLEPVRHIIEAAIEQMHVPYKELEVGDLQGIIAREIEQAQADGEVPTVDEDGNELDFLPCRQTIYNFIDRLSGWEKRRIREGIDEANREHSTRGRKPRVELPFQEWQGDHCLFPVQTCVSIRDKFGEVHRVSMGAVWCTAMVDVATQFAYPPALGIDAPSTARSLSVLRTAMCPRDDYFKRMGLAGQYDPAPVIPEMIFLDNQADNHGHNQAAMMRDFNIENGFAGSYRGDHKESIERFNRALKKFWRKFPGALPRAEDLKRGKRPRKFPVVPLPIETIRIETARFVARYNNTPQARLGNISPNEAMRRGIAKIEAARRDGMPLPLRWTMEKSVDDLDRIFSIRATAMVREYGVRHDYLEWTCDEFTDRIGHKVEIHINPLNVFKAWIFDVTDQLWFEAFGAWPLYMEGLPWTEHRLVKARVLKHENSVKNTGKRSTIDFRRRYMANGAEGLKRLFALAGKSFELNLGKKRNDRLWKDSRPVGHLDFAILSTCAVAVDLHEARIPPGMEKVMKIKKEGGIIVPMPIEKPPRDEPDYFYVDDDEDGGIIPMTRDPLARGEKGTTA